MILKSIQMIEGSTLIIIYRNYSGRNRGEVGSNFCDHSSISEEVEELLPADLMERGALARRKSFGGHKPCWKGLTMMSIDVIHLKIASVGEISLLWPCPKG